MAWTRPSGYSFGTFPERINVNQPLPVDSESGITYKVISGKLPGGLRIEGAAIVGTPYEVARLTEFTFCIRATGTTISDRTFKITIDGADAPTFVTPAGDLDIGTAHQYYVMDSTYVEYQIEAFDTDTGAGQTLKYFIASGDGELPPGLVLTDDGRIVGFVQPSLAITPEDGDGTYDNSFYDGVAYDFAYRPTNGYDSYIYDTVFFDYSLPSTRPKKLNRNYEFIVSVTDGDVTPGNEIVSTGQLDEFNNPVLVTSYVAQRKFKIFVVGDDYFRADNSTWLDGSGLFTADVTYLRAPIWLTSSDLGTHRANNYLTLILDVYDAEPITFSLEDFNPDSTASELPPGMSIDLATAEVFGTIPYQPAITKTYTFTVTATRYGDKGDEASTSRTFTVKIIGELDSVITWSSPSALGTINANFISTFKVEASSTVVDAVVLYTLADGTLPPGLTLNLDGEIVGKVNQYATVTNIGLTTFSEYSGTGLGEGTVTFANQTFDGGTTTIDRVFTFTVLARDQYNFSAVSKTFTINIDTPNQLRYSNIRTKPFLGIAQRAVWKSFINDTNVFTPESIYRPNDISFGVQTTLDMLVYAGIETSDAGKYVSAMGLNHKRKRFHFGSIKKATAIIPGTTTAVYEVVYIQMVDPLEPNGNRLPQMIRSSKQPNSILANSSNVFWAKGFPVHHDSPEHWDVRTPTLTEQELLDQLAIPAPSSERPEPIISIDSTGYRISDPNASTYFPNSISNWRDNIKYWKEDPNDANSAGLATERNYLPLWMRSIQPGTREELGFQLAVPICFCKVGAADDILLNIKYSGFDFKQLDYTADRYIIDSVDGYASDKYLVFRNDRITV